MQSELSQSNNMFETSPCMDSERLLARSLSSLHPSLIRPSVSLSPNVTSLSALCLLCLLRNSHQPLWQLTLRKTAVVRQPTGRAIRGVPRKSGELQPREVARPTVEPNRATVPLSPSLRRPSNLCRRPAKSQFQFTESYCVSSRLITEQL